MNFRIRTIAVSAVFLPALCFAQMDNPVPSNATITEIMDGIVRPAADVLWGATAVYVTEQGEDDRSPKNDEEWNTVDQSRIAMEKAITALLEPGRKVDVAGAPVSSNENLNPAEIEALIQREPEVWAAKVNALGETMQQAKTAIAARDVEALSEVGGYIDNACEGCHQHFWYPEN
jgi:hypothetical protein